jgi:pyruvate-formate lyase
MAYEALREELAASYRGLERDLAPGGPAARRREEINAKARALCDAAPRASAATLKGRLYTLLAEECETVVWTRFPFCFETALRHPWNWGCPDFAAPGSQVYRFKSERRKASTARERMALCSLWRPDQTVGLWNIYGDHYDVDHHCIGYTTLLREGLLGIRSRIAARPRQNAETRAMLAGIDAALRIAGRFAARARALLDEARATLDAEQRRCLSLAASAMERVPAHPPRTFHEGLAAILFAREVFASLDNIGISVLGRPDLLLTPLYEADLAAGRLSPDEAEDLVARWMLVHDIKMDSRSRAWPETSTTLVLGGADPRTGRFVDTPLTRLFVRVHEQNGLLSPKPNCRISAKAPADYLAFLSGSVLRGTNNFAFSNDDILVPALCRHGKSPADARNFVNGGCQEPICEGVEHSAGAGYYFNLVKAFELLFHGAPATRNPALRETLAILLGTTGTGEGAVPLSPDPPTFDAFYARTLRGLRRMLRQGAAWWRQDGRHFERFHPYPLFSSTIAGCVESGRDVAAGGARYNPTGCALVGLADIVNILAAIRIAVYERNFVSLGGLRAATRANWEGSEALRRHLLALPRFGGSDPEVAELAARVAKDITDIVAACRNERGGHFQPSFFVYYFFQHFGEATGATPDGRRAGDPLSQGIAPHRTNAPRSITDTIAFLRAIDFTSAPGNAVLDFQMPKGNGATPATMAALLRTSCEAGIPCMQPNIADASTLKAAQADPEAHADLVVRVSGLSAVFVKLDRKVQDEIIARHEFAV